MMIFKFLLGMCVILDGMAASHRPIDFIKSIEHDPKAGQKIYQSFCQNCHAPKPLIPVGAPRVGNAKDWEKRLTQGQKALLQHTIEGIGIMPARGGCFECSDEQLQKAIDYILAVD
jgi:cytochrome c5